MSEANAAAVTETPAPAAPPPEAAQADALADLLNLNGKSKAAPAADKSLTDGEKPAEKQLDKDGKSKEPDHLAAANGRKPPKEPEDPLDEGDFAPEKLNSPEAVKAAAERIVKARRQAAEFMRASHRSHAAAEKREAKNDQREAALAEREKRASIIERHQGEKQKALDDLEGADPDTFLQSIATLKKTTDPVGFWKQCTLAIAQGKPIPKQQQAQAEANPELAARLERLEQHLQRGMDQSFEQQVEQLKDVNLQAATQHAETPFVQVFASDPTTAAACREELAVIMETAAGYRKSSYQHDGRPIDIGEACRRLEERLKRNFELSQRANGKAQAGTNREKETASPGLDVGRETNTALPKPETSQATIPASLSSAPASANRPMNEEELKEWQIRQLDAVGFFD